VEMLTNGKYSFKYYWQREKLNSKKYDLMGFLYFHQWCIVPTDYRFVTETLQN
jgi:hypothetical protein